MGENIFCFEDGGIGAKDVTVFTSIAGSTTETSFCFFYGDVLRKGGGYLSKPFGILFDRTLRFRMPF